MKGNLFRGAAYFVRGLGMLTQPGLRRFVLIPLIANIVLFGIMATLLWSYVDALVTFIEGVLPSWLEFLTWLLLPFIWVAGGLLTGYGSTLLVLLITSPFHALLAEKVEERVTGQAVPALEGMAAAFADIPRSLLRELRKFTYYVPMALLVLVISFLPGLNVMAPLMWFLLGAWMMGLQFVDYPMDNHRLPFSDVRDACSAHRLTSMGFGGAVAFVSGIPLINFVVIPAAVIGATLFWCDDLRARALSH